MRSKRTVMTAGMLLLALTACSREQVGFGGQQEPPAPLAGSSLGTQQPLAGGSVDTPPAEGKVVPPPQVDASQLPSNYPRTVWTEAGDQTLGAYGQEGGCGKVHAEVREQSPATVRITFVQIAASDGMCTMDVRFPPLRVTLDAPLGQRVVVLNVVA